MNWSTIAIIGAIVGTIAGAFIGFGVGYSSIGDDDVGWGVIFAILGAVIGGVLGAFLAVVVIGIAILALLFYAFAQWLS